jgi:Macrocin-O-methyltransferase (TylF)
MRILKRLARSLMKRLPGGKEFLHKRMIYNNYLFKPGLQEIYQSLHGKDKNADAVFLPAFDRLFLLLSSFYQNGLRGDILEFGVMLGYSARILADCINRFRLSDARLYLFDSFAGLPEAVGEDQNCYECVNGIWQKGILAAPYGLERLLEYELRKRLGKDRVFAVKGFFEHTFERCIRECSIQKALLVNLDCDLYSSSKYVMRTLMEHNLLQDGTLLICDDWMTSFGNPNLGQRKAIREILEQYPNWKFEKYFNYGVGSQVFIAHDLSVSRGKKFVDENTSRCTL